MLLFCDLLLLVPHHLSRRWLFCCYSRERLINIEIIQQIGGIFNQWPYYGNQFARSDYAIYLFSSPTSFKVRNWWKHSSVLFSVPIAFTSSVSRGDAHIPTHKYAHSSPHPPVSIPVQCPLMTLTKTLSGQYLPQSGPSHVTITHILCKWWGWTPSTDKSVSAHSTTFLPSFLPVAVYKLFIYELGE